MNENERLHDVVGGQQGVESEVEAREIAVEKSVPDLQKLRGAAIARLPQLQCDKNLKTRG